MPFCTKCGNQVSQDVLFCPNCGAQIENVKSPATSPIVSDSNASSPNVNISEAAKPVIIRSFIERIIGAAKLDVSVYEEVEGDQNATIQALLVVLIGSISQGVGNAISQAMKKPDALMVGGGFFSGLVSALLFWAVWSFVTYFVGTRIFGGKANYWELLRTIGFSHSPRILGILTFIPILGGLLDFVIAIWSLVTMIIAVRQSLDFSTGKAILTCIVGFVAALVILIILGILLALPIIILGLNR